MASRQEQNRAMAQIIREYLRVSRDLAATRTILAYCAQHKAHPTGWEDQLDGMRKLPSYNDLGKTLEVIAAHLEQAADEIDLNGLLQKLLKENPIN